MQTSILYIILGLFVVGFGVVLYQLMEMKKSAQRPIDDTGMKVMMEWMKEIKETSEKTRTTMDQNLGETSKNISERLDKAAVYIGDVNRRIGEMMAITPDIRRLTETLASPKMRGNFGEQMLENLLMQFLPSSGFQSQYKFKNGETVDVIVRVGKMILPIDSKFSMENFRLFKEAKTPESQESLRKAFLKDVKKRIEEIHKKYILPQEGTFDFALMYVPSEGIYQEIIIEQEIMDFCQNKKVLAVGPNSLFAYLQNIIMSLKGQEVNKMAKEILTMIAGIKQESDKFGRNLEVLGSHIKNAGNTMGTVTNDFVKLKSSISNASSLKLDEEKEPAVQKLLE
jgi:DNA recombination protein RmuC